MSKADSGRDSQGRFTKGNKAAIKHYCHTFLVTNRLPKIRGVRKIQKNLDRVRKELESSVSKMTVQKQILIDQIVKTQGFCSLFELYARKMGLFDPQDGKKGKISFMPGFKTYISLLNSQRRALFALGLDRQAQEQILTPLEITQKESGNERY